MKFQLASGLSVLLLASGAASAQQTLTFSNTDTDSSLAGNQNQVVTLLGGSTVSIAPNGNLTAQCALTGTLCTGTGAGGGGGPLPTVSLAASAFSAGPDANGRYPSNTSFTLTSNVSNAQYCLRTVSPTTPANTGWPAPIAAVPIAAQTVFLRTVTSTYQFSLKCYNDSGSTTFTLPNIETNSTVGGGGGGSCGSFTPPLPSGWLRTQPPSTKPDVVQISGFNWNDFPNGGGRGRIATTNGRYISLQITTPTDIDTWNSLAPSKRLFWTGSQVDGPANLSNVYVSISECAGDFRMPGPGNAPTDDPTYAMGCRNFRPVSTGGTASTKTDLLYEIVTTPTSASDTICRLAPGRTYHVNFIRANVNDGIGTPNQETGLCTNPNLQSCGVDMNIE
jgi:hypothetical protein